MTTRARYGSGRHRQPLLRVTCPHCGLGCAARRTLPGHPMWIKTHLAEDGTLCPPLRLGEARIVNDPTPDPDQLALEFPASA